MLQRLKIYRINGILKKNKKIERPFCQLSDAQNIVLFLESDQKKLLLPIVKEKFQGKNLFFIIYDKEMKIIEKKDNQITFGKKSCDIWAIPETQVMSFLDKTNADLLIDMSSNSILSFKYMLGMSKKGYRCGVLKKDYPVLDFKYSNKKSQKVSICFSDLIRYLDCLGDN